MSTTVRLGPGDHGRPMSLQEFLEGDYDEGHQYEIIDGRLYVSPAPNMPHDLVQTWVQRELWRYADAHRNRVGYVSGRPRAFVTEAESRATAPEPDVAVYSRVPEGMNVNWRDVSPMLVVEIMAEGSEDKDLERNVDLYLRIPSIEEYWVFDIRDNAAEPVLIAHRRETDGWAVSEHPAGSIYTTPLLPEFELTIRPSR